MDNKEIPEIKTYYHLQREAGFLRISGEDRHGFLQRQTTNNMDLLSTDQSLVTVLTSPAGRILDVLWVIDEGESFGVLTLPGNNKETFNFLKSRIFFMDKVTVEDASQEYAQIDLFGEEVNGFVQRLTKNQVVLGDKVFKLDFFQVPVTFLEKKEFARRLLVELKDQGKLLDGLESQMAEPLAEDSYEILRVEAGLPAPHHELTEDYTPLETGFDWAVSDNKGCYTGQEVIARQINYDKVTRKLVGLHLSNSVQVGDTLYPPDSQQPVGKITSIANSPRHGNIALAIVKRPFYEPGNDLMVGEKGEGIPAKTMELPFK